MMDETVSWTQTALFGHKIYKRPHGLKTQQLFDLHPKRNAISLMLNVNT